MKFINSGKLVFFLNRVAVTKVLEINRVGVLKRTNKKAYQFTDILPRYESGDYESTMRLHS